VVIDITQQLSLRYLDVTETSYDSSQDDLIAIGEASKILGVSVQTLRRWEREGRINCYRTVMNHRRYRRGDIEQILGTASS
jgi:excisionase family DNA binding protein